MTSIHRPLRPCLLADVRPRLSSFGRDEAGSIGLFFSITCMVVLLIVAVAIDFGRAEHEKLRMQNAADAAALAASHRLGGPDQEVQGTDAAMKFFKANTDGRVSEAIESVVLDAAKGEVKVLAGGNVVTSLLNAVGIRSLDVRVASRVVKGDGMVEVALVLDNSGSMAGQPIADLTQAARNLVGVVFTGAEQSDRVKVSVVPFSGAVNVGAFHRDSPWMDEAGGSPLNGANFASNVPRLQMFDRLSAPWRGCVEARPAPHDVSDSAAVPDQPATMFVPMFAPDEPDADNADGAHYANNYIADDGGACSPQPTVCAKSNRRGKCTEWRKSPLPPAEAQARICKYEGAAVPIGSPGPNYMCDSGPILPLTADRGEIEAKLSALTARGNTNIPEGLMWGWRTLSPGDPFPEGRAYDTPTNEKVIVLMTDGANTYSAASNHNRSTYGAHGYGVAHRLGTTYTSSAYASRMNQKLQAACANAKAAGIKIYTVAFRLETDPTTQALLQGCASEATMAFRASDGETLISAFERIGSEISKLRVSG